MSICRGHASIMQTHANEAVHDGGSRGWSPWCTCIFVIPVFDRHGTGLSQEPHPAFLSVSTISCRGLHVWAMWFFFKLNLFLQLFDFKCTGFGDGSIVILSGVMEEVFLQVRCIPRQNSQWQFWASVCVCVSKASRQASKAYISNGDSMWGQSCSQVVGTLICPDKPKRKLW